MTKKGKSVDGKGLAKAKPCALVAPQDDSHVQEVPCC